MRRRAIFQAVLVTLLGGCAAVSSWWAPPPPAPAQPSPPPAVVAEPARPPAPDAERARRIAAARADLKVALTQLELRAVSACDKGRLLGEGCAEVQQLIDRARAADERLVKALLNPKLDVDWDGTGKLLRLIIEQSKEAKP